MAYKQIRVQIDGQKLRALIREKTTVQDLARRIGCSDATLYTWMRKGEMPISLAIDVGNKLGIGSMTVRSNGRAEYFLDL